MATAHRQRWIWIFALLLVGTLGCSEDLGDEDLPADAGHVDASDSSVDAAREDVAQDSAEDTDQGIREIDGNLETLASCASICQEHGLVCDDSHEHFMLGKGGALLDYGGSEGKESCAHEPSRTEDTLTGENVEITSYTCYCRST